MPVQLFTASGSEMRVLGQSDVVITTADPIKQQQTCTSKFIIAESVSHQALISWHDLQKLKIIPHSFPIATAMSTHSMDSVKEKLFSAFEDVFRDSLLEEPMAGEPVHIKLKSGATPFRMSVARQIPLRFEKPASEVIQGLIKNNVIVPCTEPTDWCAPGFFVVKADGKSVRLVTDYTKLNSFVERPVHPFPSVHEILKSIPASAKIFAKFDAVNGYFQIGMDEASSKLTTFILPSGRYRYLRIPQGLNASSDEWCRRSDVAIEGLSWCRKLVDDILVWAANLDELEERMHIIASRCEKLNLILSKKKCAIGTSLPFAGYIVSSEGVSPDQERVVALSKFPVPKDSTGVKSFLGLANQFSVFFHPRFRAKYKVASGALGERQSFQMAT